MQLNIKQAEEKLAERNICSWNSKVEASMKVFFLDIIPMPTEEICQTFNELRWERTVCVWQCFLLNLFTYLLLHFPSIQVQTYGLHWQGISSAIEIQTYDLHWQGISSVRKCPFSITLILLSVFSFNLPLYLGGVKVIRPRSN